MRTIKLTDEQYDLIELALGIAKTYFEEQLDVLEEVAPTWKFPMTADVGSTYHDVEELRRDFEMGKLEEK